MFEYLRKNLETDRKKHFKPYTFKLNSNLSNLIRNKLLLDCELFRNDFRISGTDSKIYSDFSSDQKAKYPKALDDIEQEKNRIKGEVDADKNIYGFTINAPYTTNQDIWEKIQ